VNRRLLFNTEPSESQYPGIFKFGFQRSIWGSRFLIRPPRSPEISASDRSAKPVSTFFDASRFCFQYLLKQTVVLQIRVDSRLRKEKRKALMLHSGFWGELARTREKCRFK
jgi:hypothetical protein